MLKLPGAPNVALFMPGFMEAADSIGTSLVIKTVTIFPANPRRGLPMNQGALLAFDAELNPDQEIINTAANQQLYYREITREYEPEPTTGAVYLYKPDSDLVNEIDFKEGAGVLAKSVRVWDAERDALARRKHVIRNSPVIGTCNPMRYRLQMRVTNPGDSGQFLRAAGQHGGHVRARA